MRTQKMKNGWSPSATTCYIIHAKSCRKGPPTKNHTFIYLKVSCPVVKQDFGQLRFAVLAYNTTSQAKKWLTSAQLASVFPSLCRQSLLSTSFLKLSIMLTPLGWLHAILYLMDDLRSRHMISDSLRIAAQIEH